jgi:3-methylfumaryl-CoA hydratase
MWASGTVTGLGPLRCGRSASRRTQVLGSQDKEGRSGRMTFVTVGHEIVQDGVVVIREEQNIVYRDAAPPAGGVADAASRATSGMPEQPAVPIGPDEWEVLIDPTLLFRYSALTYNAHRIHYDRDFARDVEGYPGLVVHGPLQATLMAEAARRRGLVEPGRPVVFDYRMQSPLFDHQGLVVAAVSGPDGVATSVRDRWGRVTATGSLRPSS